MVRLQLPPGSTSLRPRRKSGRRPPRRSPPRTEAGFPRTRGLRLGQPVAVCQTPAFAKATARRAMRKHQQRTNTSRARKRSCRVQTLYERQMATNVATALEIDVEDHIRPVTWDEWITLPICDGDNAMHTMRGAIRVPTTIVALNSRECPRSAQSSAQRRSASVTAIVASTRASCCVRTKAALTTSFLVHAAVRTLGKISCGPDKSVNAKKGNRLPHEA